MNAKVYRHILSIYGRRFGFWFGIGAEAIRTFIIRVYVVILLANMVGAISTGNFDHAKQDIILYLIAYVVAVAIGTVGDLTAIRSENAVYAKQMVEYYKKLTNKDMSFYRDSHTGYLTTMFRQYLDGVILLVRMVRTDIVRTSISLTIPAIILFIYSWQVGLVALAMILLQMIYIFWASSKVNVHRQKAHEIYRSISAEVADDITNITAYKAAGAEEESQNRIKDLAAQEHRIFGRRHSIPVIYDIPRSVLTVTLVCLSFWLILSSGDSKSQTVALLVMTITYMFQIVRNMSELPDTVTKLDDLVTKLEPTLETLEDTHELITDKPNANTLDVKKASIEINDLGFSYQDSDEHNHVFKNLNISIKAGEHIGIVGLSGAGKSTLASLLMRFDDATSGTIEINGTNVQDVTQSSLRRSIAYVPQEPVLFHRTIGENIAYHNEKASAEEIQKASKAAHATEFIEKLPMGYDTIVGERGVKLSGGQKQRVVIARAILKNAPIILFDEATSALDSHSEHIIQQALPGIIGNHTAIIIAHRLSTVAGLDRIIVMHNGAIEEQGTHKELLKLRGRYYSLWQRQTNSN